MVPFSNRITITVIYPYNLDSPEAMRFAQNQHKIGYGDESWATDSMMRNQSIQQQYHPGILL